MNERFFRRRGCWFCGEGQDVIDYKDVELLRRYVAMRGKITPNRITGSCARHQRSLTRAIKRARVAALIPFVPD